MRLFSRQTCIVCKRPAPPQALVCAYCSEDLPQRRRLLCQRAGIAGAALLATAAFTAVHGGIAFPAKLTLPGATLVALGTGLALLPPKLRGVAGAMPRERLGQVAPRYCGGIVLALLTALLVVLTAGAPQPWTIAETTLAAAATLALLAAPAALDLPWHKLMAGILLAAGLLLPR